jgi:hypothetical protein
MPVGVDRVVEFGLGRSRFGLDTVGRGVDRGRDLRA